MARRSDHTREELRELALSSARAIVDEGGLGALTVRSITSRMGYTVGTLYQMFKSLDDVVLHINAVTLEELLEKLRLAEDGKHPIARMAHSYMDYSRAHLRRWSLLFEHRLPEGAALPDWYQEKIDAIFTLLEQAVMKELGTTRATARKAAQVLWAGLHGICTLSLSGKLDVAGPASAGKLADMFVGSFLTGLKADA
ncbi:TetR family transcriptional regulator [bacterium]|nr:TetR family transcriptional regulator [bacterium]